MCDEKDHQFVPISPAQGQLFIFCQKCGSSLKLTVDGCIIKPAKCDDGLVTARSLLDS